MDRREFFGSTCASLGASAIFASPFTKERAKKLSLVTAERKYSDDIKAEPRCDIVRRTIVDGRLGEKEVLLSCDHKLFEGLIGQRIYENRYLVTRWLFPCVVDLEKRKLIKVDECWSFVGIDRGCLIYIDFQQGKQKVVYSLDLVTKTKTRLSKLGKSMDGWFSPDFSRVINGLNVTTMEGKSFSLGDGFTRQHAPFEGEMPSFPSYWANNNIVLTQTTNGTLVLVDVDTGKRAPFLKVEDENISKNIPLRPGLYLNGYGMLIYEALHQYHIDLKNATATKLEGKGWMDLGHGFRCQDATESTIVRHTYRIGNEDLGIQTCAISATAPGHLAIACSQESTNPRLPDAAVDTSKLRVWCEWNKRWQDEYIHFHCALAWYSH